MIIENIVFIQTDRYGTIDLANVSDQEFMYFFEHATPPYVSYINLQSKYAPF